MDLKNDPLSKIYRDIGNEHFRKKEYYDALLQYNQSLCVAEIGSDSISIAYANRSVVYIKLNQFDVGLENIQRARDSNYPKDKIKKLNKREEECKELMKTQKPNPDDDPFNFFKLSYPSHPKYPQIVDCLQLHNNKTLGIVTTRDLNTGDIIGIEEPVCVIVTDEARLNCCNFCMKDNLLSLIPCSGCTKAMFCSQKCQQKSMSGYHSFKCNNNSIRLTIASVEFMIHQMVESLSAFDYNVKELQMFLKANKGNNLFDFDLSDSMDPMYKKNMIFVLASMKYTGNFDKSIPFVSKMFADFAKHIPKLNELWKSDRKFIQDFFQDQVLNRCNFNMQTCSNTIQNQQSAGSSVPGKAKLVCQKKTGHGSYLFGGMLNHSCDPNVKCVFVSNKCVYYVCKPIKKGSQIFKAFLPFTNPQTKAERQELLKLKLGKDCDCPACENDWPTFDELRSIDPTFQDKNVNMLATHDQAKKNIARNNVYVDKNYKENDPTQEVYMTIQNNLLDLWALARPSFYP